MVVQALWLSPLRWRFSQMIILRKKDENCWWKPQRKKHWWLSREFESNSRMPLLVTTYACVTLWVLYEHSDGLL